MSPPSELRMPWPLESFRYRGGRTSERLSWFALVSVLRKSSLVSKDVFDCHTFGCLDANLLEPLCLLHGPYNSLHQLFNLLVQTSDISVLLRWLFINLHGLDSAVIFGGQCVQNEI